MSKYKTLALSIALVTILPIVLAPSTVSASYDFSFTIHRSKSGCVQMMVKIPDEKSMLDAAAIIIINSNGEVIAGGITGHGGKVRFCNVFQPNTEYAAIIIDKYGNTLWGGTFWTNEKSTVAEPVKVRY